MPRGQNSLTVTLCTKDIRDYEAQKPQTALAGAIEALGLPPLGAA